MLLVNLVKDYFNLKITYCVLQKYYVLNGSITIDFLTTQTHTSEQELGRERQTHKIISFHNNTNHTKKERKRKKRKA